MEIVRFVIRRLRAQRALAVGIVVTLAFAIAGIASAPIFIDGARAAIYQSSFANAPEPVRDIRISLFAQPTDGPRATSRFGLRSRTCRRIPSWPKGWRTRGCPTTRGS